MKTRALLIILTFLLITSVFCFFSYGCEIVMDNNATNGIDASITQTGVKDIYIDENNELYVTFLDGTTKKVSLPLHGQDGKDGLNGQDGAKGEKGDKGDKGDPGKDGKDGLNGQDGAKGEKGDKGDKGDPGKDGKDGLNGQDGAKGEKGDKGDKGDPGKDGKDGLNGQDGAKGEKGDKGDKGDPGQDGKDGLNGQDGAKGEKGDKGDPGQDGKDGLNGQDGAKGEKGDKGDKGDPGKDGKDGLNGQDGAKGEKGDKGDKGDPGQDGKDGLNGKDAPIITNVTTEITFVNCVQVMRFTFVFSNGSKIFSDTPYPFGESEVIQHVFNKEWSYDDSNHWHASSCAHQGLIANQTPHSFEKGQCSVCLKKQQYKIIFDYKDATAGNTVKEISVLYGNNITLPTPQKDGYDFAGWKINGHTVTEKNYKFESTVSLNATAVWETKNYQLSFNYPNLSQKAFKFGESISNLPTPEQPGYDFIGWQIDENELKNGDLWNFTSNKTAEPIWQAKTYTLTFDPNGGSCSSTTVTVTYNESFTLPNAEKTGYNFVGWKIDDDIITDESIWNYTADKTATAVWQAETYTLTLNANGGSCSSTTVTVTYNESFTLPNAEKTGFIFVGWQVENEILSAESAWKYTSDKTATAVWKESNSTLVFTENEEKTGYAVAAQDTTITSAIIPATYNGKPVTEIKANAFENCSSLKTVSIPESVTVIGNNAFSNCSALEYIVIPKGVTIISQTTFKNCSSLKYAVLPQLATIGKWAFQGCSALTEIFFTYSDDSAENAPTITNPNKEYNNAKKYYYNESATTVGYWKYVDGKPTPCT